MAILYTTDGRSRAVAPKNGTDFQLHELYELLGVRMIEVIGSRLLRASAKDSILVIDEEGKLKGSPTNAAATRLITFDDVIVGNALLCKRSEVQ
jgi:predicted metallopeptidase